MSFGILMHGFFGNKQYAAIAPNIFLDELFPILLYLGFYSCGWCRDDISISLTVLIHKELADGYLAAKHRLLGKINNS